MSYVSGAYQFGIVFDVVHCGKNKSEYMTRRGPFGAGGTGARNILFVSLQKVEARQWGGRRTAHAIFFI